jgi:hypothetical protein
MVRDETQTIRSGLAKRSTWRNASTNIERSKEEAVSKVHFLSNLVGLPRRPGRGRVPSQQHYIKGHIANQ